MSLTRRSATRMPVSSSALSRLRVGYGGGFRCARQAATNGGFSMPGLRNGVAQLGSTAGAQSSPLQRRRREQPARISARCLTKRPSGMAAAN